MAQATKCDLTGEVSAGEAARYVDVDVGPKLRIRAMILVQRTPTSWEQGDLGPAGVAAVNKAVATLKVAK